MCTEEHPEGERVPQRRWICRTILAVQSSGICEEAVGLRAESIVATERTHIFHAPIGRVHAGEASPVHFEREGVEKRAAVERHKVLRLPPAHTHPQRVQQVECCSGPESRTGVERPQLSRLLVGTERVQFHFRRIQHTVIPCFAQLQPDAAVAERLHAHVCVVLLPAAVLHSHLQGHIERPAVATWVQ